MLREFFGYSKPREAPVRQLKPSSATCTESILGANTLFEGTLKNAGDVRLDGDFVGDIAAQGKVTIGEQGKLEGNLVGEVAAVAGIVRGDITARKVSILRTGRVWGNLRLETLMTEEGGFIQGLVTMEEELDLSEVTMQSRPDKAEKKVTEKAKSPTEKENVPVE